MAIIKSTNYGIASGADTDTFTSVELCAGDTPQVVTAHAVVGAAGTAGIPAWTPIKVNAGTGAITLAVSGTTEPNAITVHDVPAGTASTSTVGIYKAGMFNIEALNWPVSYDTDAKKFGAFAAGGENQIFVKKPYYS